MLLIKAVFSIHKAFPRLYILRTTACRSFGFFHLFFDFILLYILSCPGYRQFAPCVFTFWTFKSKTTFSLNFIVIILRRGLLFTYLQYNLQLHRFYKKKMYRLSKAPATNENFQGLKHNKVGGEIY